MNRELLFLKQADLQLLIDSLLSSGYRCIGPQVKDGAIVYAPLQSIHQLPQGINDQQSPGHYSLKQNNSKQYFNWANGPQAIKPLLFTPREQLWQSERNDEGEVSFKAAPVVEDSTAPATAILAARACDIAAMKLQDQHFIQADYTDPAYQARRQNLFVIAVNCGHPAGTCFCHSTGDGPFVNPSNEDAVDILLTELDDGFLLQANTARAEPVLKDLPLYTASDAQRDASLAIQQKASQQSRKLPTITKAGAASSASTTQHIDIPGELSKHLKHPAWEAIAERCLSCGNCTSVCPSCFCYSEQDLASLDGSVVNHYREWDSCFTQGHSYIHGITIRSETSQRYRQWLSHKFSSWVQQYGRSGCVGCGRCISWCPVGIDVIESIEQVLEITHE